MDKLTVTVYKIVLGIPGIKAIYYKKVGKTSVVH